MQTRLLLTYRLEALLVTVSARDMPLIFIFVYLPVSYGVINTFAAVAAW